MIDEIATLRDKARSLARDIRGIQDNVNRLLDPDSAFDLGAPPIDETTLNEWHHAYSNKVRLEAELVAILRRLLDLKG